MPNAISRSDISEGLAILKRRLSEGEPVEEAIVILQGLLSRLESIKRYRIGESGLSPDEEVAWRKVEAMHAKR